MRVAQIVLVVAGVLSGLGQFVRVVDAQVCRRQCRRGETRDVRGCCVKRTSPRVRLSAAVRVEADVRHATVIIGRRRHSVRLPKTLRVRQGTHKITIRAGKSVWRGTINARRGKTTSVFASLRGGEWPQTARQRVRSRRILDAAIVAKGGDKLARLTSMRYIGASTAAATKYANWSQTLTWDRRRRRQRWQFATKDRRIVHGLTNTQAWTADYKNGTLARVDTRRPFSWDVAQLWWHPDSVLSRRSSPGVRIALLPGQRVAGAQTDVIQIARSDGGARARLFIDRRSHLVVRIQPILRDGRFDRPIDLSDYRRVDGIAVAFRWKYQQLDVRWAQVKTNVVLARTFFDPPAAPAPPADKIVTLRHARVNGVGGVGNVNRDNTPDVIARLTVTVVKRRNGAELSRRRHRLIAAYDGRTFKQLWRRRFKLGPLSVTVVRNIVLVGPGLEPTLLALDARTGRTLKKFKMTDRVRYLCDRPTGKFRPRTKPRPPGPNNEVWVQVADRGNVMFNAKTLKAKSWGRPLWCRKRSCSRSGHRPRVGCNSFIILRNTNLGARYWMPYKGGKVVIGIRRRGTKFPLVFRYNKKRMRVWNGRLGRNAQTGRVFDAGLGADNLVYAYRDVAGKYRVGARRLDTGKEAWDVVAGGGAYPTVTDSRVYIERRSGVLDILDTKTGRRLGTIGDGKLVVTP